MTEPTRKTDRHEQFVAEALMLRALHSYREARERAMDGGVDLSIAPEPPSSYGALSDRYSLWCSFFLAGTISSPSFRFSGSRRCGRNPRHPSNLTA